MVEIKEPKTETIEKEEQPEKELELSEDKE